MRSSRVVIVSDSQCRSRNCPGFDPTILRHSGILGAADEAVLNTVHKKGKYPKNPPLKNSTRCSHSAVSIGNNIFLNRIMKFQKYGHSYFQIKTTKMVPWICYLLFQSIFSGLGIEVWLFPFGFHEIQISIRQTNFQYIFSQLMKRKNLGGTIHSL